MGKKKKLKPFTARQIREYIENGGRACPACGSEEIDVGGIVTSSRTQGSSYCICWHCDTRWMNVYVLNNCIRE
jgi:formate dehydrogenase maturation protein FdhE